MKRRLLNLSFALTLLAATSVAAQQREYFNDAEVDRMRDAQGLEYRIPLLIHMADKRLVVLGVKVLTDKEKDAIKKDESKLDDLVYKTTGRVPIRPKDPDAYLREYSKLELLHGYAETIDDLMNYIEDAHTRKLDVRPSLEILEKYARATRPLLNDFKPTNDAEKIALEEAKQNTDDALEGAVEALETIPLTEKKPPKP